MRSAGLLCLFCTQCQALSLVKPPHRSSARPSLAASERVSEEGRREATAAACTQLSDRRRFMSGLGAVTLAAGLLWPATAGAADAEFTWIPARDMAADSESGEQGPSYPPYFCAYLARFLLNFDENCRNFFMDSVSVGRATGRSDAEWHAFASLSSSVDVGLRRYRGNAGAESLAKQLWERYNGESDASRQLGLLFSMLPAEQQPVPFLQGVMAEAAAESSRKAKLGGRRRRESGEQALLALGAQTAAGLRTDEPLRSFNSGFGVGLGITASDVARLLASPMALLPEGVFATFDGRLGAYRTPGLKPLLGPFRGLGNAADDNAADDEQLAAWAAEPPAAAAAWASRSAFGPLGKAPPQRERALSVADYALFAACGGLGCTVTHATVIPLDVVKTRLQTSPGRYSGLVEGVQTIAREEGWPMLLQGSGPTVLGYLWYGVTVYPGYEFFKRLFRELAGPVLAEGLRVPLVLLAGASATVIACLGVCPCEAIRIRQVAEPEVGGLVAATQRIVGESGWGKLYEGLPPILVRQVSFGMMKFLVFETVSEAAYRIFPALGQQTSTQLAVSLCSGLLAGIASAIVSQPADTVLSAMNKKGGRANILTTAMEIVQDFGPAGLFLGLASRILWAGAIISGQFLFYDAMKAALHVSPDDLRLSLDVLRSVFEAAPEAV